MKESEMKKKTCPELLIMKVIVQATLVMNSGNEDSIRAAKQLGYCTGSACAKWEDWEYTQALVLPDRMKFLKAGR